MLNYNTKSLIFLDLMEYLKDCKVIVKIMSKIKLLA